MRHKSGCQRDNQNCTFLFEQVWWSALPLNYAAWINLCWKMSGKVEWWYLISTDATQWEHQTAAGNECAEGCVTVGGGWLARLSPRLVRAVNNMFHQWKASPPPYTTFLIKYRVLNSFQLSIFATIYIFLAFIHLSSMLHPRRDGIFRMYSTLKRQKFF